MDSSSEESKDKSGSDLLSESASSCESKQSSDDSSSAQLGWPIQRAATCLVSEATDVKTKPHLNVEDDSKLEKKGSKFSELEMMKERFAKLLLGEDMSGSGKGVSPALAISNAITNLCASVFGQLWRLEPLPVEKKSIWQREMEWLLRVSDHIVEMIPSWQTLPDGTKLEVMKCQPRSDLVINLPALRKLDNMLLEILDGFTNSEFWYVDHGVIAQETADGSGSFRKGVHRQEEKWWLPVPRVPPGGLGETTRTVLTHKRECAGQILKAAVSINSIALSEMDVPESYLETLPKNGRTCLGDVIYRYITLEHFSSECLLDCLDLSSEHVALEIANRVEAAIHVWRRRQHPKPQTHPNRPTGKTSWEMVKDLMIDGGDKRELFAERAESLLQCLKQRFPGLTQTTLDASKIQCNKDVGKAILESYSRVLESLAFSITSRIEDLLYVDDINRQSDKSSSNMSTVSIVSRKKTSIPLPVSASCTPYRTACTSQSFSPAPLTSPSRRTDRTPFLNGFSSKPPRCGLGVKRVLTNYLAGDAKVKNHGNALEEGVGSVSNRVMNDGSASSRWSVGSRDHHPSSGGGRSDAWHQTLDR